MGIWMGYFIKNISSSMEFFKWNEKKVIVAWLAVFVIGIAASFWLSHGAEQQLKKTVIPEDSALHFQDWRSMFEFSMAFFFLPLLFLSNVYSVSTKRVNVLLYVFTFLYAALFSYKNLRHLNDFFQLWEKHFGVENLSVTQSFSHPWVYISVYAFLCLFNMISIGWGLKK
jgi:hypothetical protein